MALIPHWKWTYGWDCSVPEEGQQIGLSERRGKCRKVDNLLKNETHYILVIHGTFDAPNPDYTPPKWYQLDPQNPENFTTMLQCFIDFLHQEITPPPGDPRESTTGGGGEGGETRQRDKSGQYGVWKRLPGDMPEALLELDPEHSVWSPFAWDGENKDESRVKAGNRLGMLMHSIATQDPSARIHVIAHSHGGNVLLKAVEKYMGELAVQSQADWIPEIRQSFWSAYRGPWQMVRKWRRVPHVSYWRRLIPFLVVFRTLTGDLTRGLERYPFAYHKWVDDMLGLGAIRQQIYLQHRKASSPVTNALGNLVFLGTPFLVRRFSRAGMVTLGVMIVVKAAVAAVLLWAYTGAIFLLSTHDQRWYNVFNALTLLYLMVFIVALVVMACSSIGTAVLQHGNIYHHTTFNWSSSMHCLVTHAGLLDEAAMGLSAEPVVEGLLEPKMTNLLLASRFQSWPALPKNKCSILQWTFYLGRVLFSLWINALGLIPLIQTIIGNVLGPVFGSTLKTMLMQMTLGLSERDYSYGRIDVEHVLRLPVADVQHWNVQRLIAAHQQKDSRFALKLKNGQSLKAAEIVEYQMKMQLQQRAQEGEQRLEALGRISGQQSSTFSFSPSPDSMNNVRGLLLESSPSRVLLNGHSNSTTEASKYEEELGNTMSRGSSKLISEYSFLWNKEELEREAQGSSLYKALEHRLDKLRRNPDLTESQFRDEMKGICIMFEKRIQDIAGGVEFSHSIYFKNATIIYAIAHFMIHRELPDWANEELGVARGVSIKMSVD